MAAARHRCSSNRARRPPPANDREAAFVSTVLRNTEVVWSDIFQKNGGTYHAPRLVLFRGATPTACGTGESAMGPFYCPGDKKVYIDLGFYDTLKNQLGAPGEFAQAYVIAHEVGHHVQDELGITAKVDGMRRRLSQSQNNAMSVRVELQADCFAGIWAHHSQESKKWLDPGDIEAAMNAAQKIGDDALQRSAGRAVVPTASPTAPARSASAGSEPAIKRAACRPATPSTRATSDGCTLLPDSARSWIARQCFIVCY